MAPEVQAPASPSPHHSPPHPPEAGHAAVADLPPPVSPARNEWPEPERPPSAPDSPSPPHSAAAVVSTEPHVAAAKYVPPQAASRTADQEWYSWNGGRSARHASRSRPAPPPRRQWTEEAPPPPPRRQWAEEAPPPAPAPVPPPRPAAPPAPHPPPPAARSVDRVVPDILSRKRRAAALQRAALVARATAAGLCLAALAVLAADTRKGWALDSYNRYSQLQYSEAMNVIGFVYSLLQFGALADLMRKNKHLIPHPKRDLFDFAMDQVLAYLLISSSSSATARVGDWIDNWGSDPFPNMANGSIVISFLAFVVFAICALISAYNLFRRDL
ncbi:hypothetical protein PR202_gb06143 [Eleusine coracana subsp. coracana]|uniref:CASP-like protein n=1 Tax=Eleusine coracana subsp. coracana TaxID=191504 RepID=A0AAV5E9Q5_ELECO|nr:hypothetical protein QOZ80_2BG0154170 [Eleusine coracana subsp. coracana]GJN18931.1 hypothetical protein PR202_gb06143 [Eleusine coracana subsp. coracana]